MISGDEEVENIDKSEWVKWTKDDPMVKDERSLKGDMRIVRDDVSGQVRYAQALVRNIMGWLWVNGHIDDQNYHDGRTYELWREVAHAQFGGVRRNTVYAAARGEMQAEGLNEYGFILLLQRLSRDEQAWIESAILTFQRPYTVMLAQRRAKRYASAFSRLTVLIPEVRDQLQAIAEARKTSPLPDDLALKVLAERMGLKNNA
jgi:hypothetical protein